MQKKLIALAVAGLASSAAFAQSNVTIYGVLKPSYDFVSTKTNAGADTKTQRINDNASLIGFQGQEDLGNGLKAIFKLESYFNITQSDNGSAYGQGSFTGGRDTWLGLQGGFGTFRIGAQDSAYKAVSASYDFFADSIGDYNNILTNGTGSRDPQSLYYISPTWSGFKLQASYALDANGKVDTGNASTSTDARKMAVAGDYTWGGLNAFLAWTNGERPVGDSDEQIRAGAKYVFGNKASLGLIYENVERYNATTKTRDQDSWWLGGTFPVTGNVNLLGSYIQANDNTAPAAPGDQGAKNYNLGAEYLFSKRTKIAGLYSYIKNKGDGTTGGTFGYDSGYAISAGGKGSALSVRLQHSF
jgi:predicted porin